MLVRTALNTTNLTYGSTNLPIGGVQSWVLAPGTNLTVVVGLNRSLMNSTPGGLFAGILKFTDSYNFTEVDIPVSAIQSSLAGLWVGNASVSQVANYLKNLPVGTRTTRRWFRATAITSSPASTPIWARFPPRFPCVPDRATTSGTNAVLLQRVFYGLSPHTNGNDRHQRKSSDPNHLDIAAAHQRRSPATLTPPTRRSCSPASSCWAAC